MGTHHTGIPLTRRNIQPPPIPVVRMVINEVVPNYANDTKVFYVTITGINGYYAAYVPISVSQPIILNNLQYGAYYISQNAESGYTQISVSPSSFTLSADNPQQTVTITTVKNVGQVTVTKTITGVTEDETYFDITITGIDNEYVEQFGQVRLDEPLIFYDLPFGSYVITEAEAEGYTLDSITPSGFELNVNVLTVDVEIVNTKNPEITLIKYGALYNWYAATDIRKITSSEDWVVPRYTILSNGGDFYILNNFLNPQSGGKLKEVSEFWASPNEGATNSSKFNARGSGYRGETGPFGNINITTTYWESASEDANNATTSGLNRLSDDFAAGDSVGYSPVPKKYGLSLRIVKKSTTLLNGEEGTYTGNDGKAYRTICIGTQEWLADNLCETKYRNGDMIPIVTDNTAWAALTTGAMCYYNNDINNAFIFE